MKTIKLDVKESIFDYVMFFLNNLPKQDINLKVETNENLPLKQKKLNAISIKTKGFKFDRKEAHDR